MKKNLTIILFTLCCSSCSTISSIWPFGDDIKPSPQLVVNITAHNNINPNLAGVASPIELRLYQLNDSEAFSQTDFISLYTDPQGALKAGLLSARNLSSIFPGQSKKFTYPLNAQTQFIGIIAAFADYRQAKTKGIYKVLLSHGAIININLDGLNLSVSGEIEDK
ncbi:type VI secretion system lipoprotein TssJ [Parashewanella curva]|uniref:Type VI secretion system lipoprotein TssJ n=1 Tax=Parashewanella curva TaxID=2338552 RepID=A0A3L8Q0P3_9GAMM|nr:type VI secretion system lipoprotein TssJ [Parashewanella curva]RLV61247.1 type VI secretion system lipoprotein TssJ [Parashewanella curva]